MPSISVPTALLVGGGLAAAGGVASAVIGSNAAKSAAKTQSNAATAASEAQLQMFHETEKNISPFLDAGKSAIPQVENLLGLGSGGQAGIQTALENTPGYQFTLKQGLQATQNSYAAQGLAQSGSALKGAAQYATGLANSTYEQRLADYFGLMGSGQNAASQLGTFGQNAVAASNNYLTSGAAARAAGTVGAANALTSGIGAATGGIGNAALLLAANNAGMFGGGNAGFSPEPIGVTPSVFGTGGYNAPYIGGYPTVGG